MRILVLGLGNPILGDDGLGMRAVAHVVDSLGPDPGVDVGDEQGCSLTVMERMAGYDAVILVDAAHTGACPPGTVLRFPIDPMPDWHTGASPHVLSVAEALRLGTELGLAMPRLVRVVAVEARNLSEFSDRCSPEVETALPRAVRAVLEEIDALRAGADSPSGGT